MADIRVNGETLRSGAKDTDAVAAGVAQARDAAGAALADNAFGLMCSPLFLPTYTLVKTAADAMMVCARDGTQQRHRPAGRRYCPGGHRLQLRRRCASAGSVIDNG